MQNNCCTEDTVNHKKKKGCCHVKCLFIKEELSAMRQQVLDLNQMIESLMNSLQIKDAQYNEIRGMNDLLLIELKKRRSSNHILKQQLEEERSLYGNKKDHLESKNDERTGCCSDFESENKDLKEQLIVKTQTVFNLSQKLLQMKHAKDILQSKLDRKSADHIRIIAEMLEKLDEAERELSAIIPAKFREPLPASKVKLLQIVQRNARLVHENAVLKAQLQKSLENVKASQKYDERSRSAYVGSRKIINAMEETGRDFSKNSKWSFFL